MANTAKISIWAIGFAMFSMFFGAGNVVFPIVLGQHAGSQNIYAILGLLVTAVLVPFLGLASMLMFNGDYDAFFGRIGKWPGLLVAFIIMAFIGPFGAIPRCVTLTYSTLHLYVENLQLVYFSFAACILVFLLSLKPNRVVSILGKVLTPLLLVSLVIIIIAGFLGSKSAQHTTHSSLGIFVYSLKQGYNTMDLFAGLFFSIVIIPAFKMILGDNLEQQPKQVGLLSIKTSLVGMSLLAVIYTGMSFVAAFHAESLAGVPIDQQLGAVAHIILGPYAGFVANAAVMLACLTTAISLSVVFAEFVNKELFGDKASYPLILGFACIVTFFLSLMGFTGLLRILEPVLVAFCPALIVLTLLNLAYKITGYTLVKPFVYGTFVLTLVLTYAI